MFQRPWIKQSKCRKTWSRGKDRRRLHKFWNFWGVCTRKRKKFFLFRKWINWPLCRTKYSTSSKLKMLSWTNSKKRTSPKAKKSLELEIYLSSPDTSSSMVQVDLWMSSEIAWWSSNTSIRTNMQHILKKILKEGKKSAIYGKK